MPLCPVPHGRAHAGVEQGTATALPQQRPQSIPQGRPSRGSSKWPQMAKPKGWWPRVGRVGASPGATELQLVLPTGASSEGARAGSLAAEGTSGSEPCCWSPQKADSRQEPGTGQGLLLLLQKPAGKLPTKCLGMREKAEGAEGLPGSSRLCVGTTWASPAPAEGAGGAGTPSLRDCARMHWAWEGGTIGCTMPGAAESTSGAGQEHGHIGS